MIPDNSLTRDEFEKICRIIKGSCNRIRSSRQAVLLLDEGLNESLDDEKIRQIQTKIDNHREQIQKWQKVLRNFKAYLARKRERLSKKANHF